uniref:Uncharacterized protein n=1 Tax=Candidatus Kentrum sp. TC TaxID=2126339 RepID=A0A450YIZ8_9GAMM|nr:MAG: hypothetical protein BECKTC1821D_GA0114238_101050 [Candidatus Kentron sp. TC]
MSIKDIDLGIGDRAAYGREFVFRIPDQGGGRNDRILSRTVIIHQIETEGWAWKMTKPIPTGQHGSPSRTLRPLQAQ